jgi:hypothetical protein
VITFGTLIVVCIASVMMVIHTMMKRIERLELLLMSTCTVLRVVTKQLVEKERTPDNSALTDDELFEVVAKNLGL